MPEELKEEDRLAATVEMITEESMIIPRGAFFKHPNGVTTENPGFPGLTPLESKDLKSYLHARLPREKWDRNLLTRVDYNYSVDFLDPVEMDPLNGKENFPKFITQILIIR